MKLFAGNIIMEQPIQSSEQREKVNLSELPKDILEQILIHLDDEHLLKASHVCKSFASAAETAFARKYSNKCYDITHKDDAMKNSFHKVILMKYGGKIQNLDIFIVHDEDLLDLVEQKGGNLESLKLYVVPKIIMVNNLKEVYLGLIHNLTREQFAEFINNNPQLVSFKLKHFDIDLLDLLDGRLKMLKTLKYNRRSSFNKDLPKIKLNSLETLKLQLPSAGDYVRLLQAMSCNEIKALDLRYYSDNDDMVINEICSFQTLGSLQMQSCRITEDQMKKLAGHLLHLTEFGMEIADCWSNPENKLFSAM